MIRIAIVEDEKEYEQLITQYLSRYAQENGIQFSISRFNDGEEIVSHYKSQFDVILMDIEMASMDGMTAAHKIRQTDAKVVIIFITNMAQYAIQGYEVDALDFILKPIEYFPFSQRLGRAFERIPHEDSKYLIISSKNGTNRIPLSSLKWVESKGHRLNYHTTSGEFESTVTSMKDLTKKLEPENFFQCNKGILVNLAFVTGIVGTYAVLDTDRILISQSKRHDFMHKLTQIQI